MSQRAQPGTVRSIDNRHVAVMSLALSSLGLSVEPVRSHLIWNASRNLLQNVSVYDFTI